MDIWNGPHHNETPIGNIRGPSGELITIWSDKPVYLLDAMIRAIGALPNPQEFGMGGHVEVIYDHDSPVAGSPPQVIYNPAGDVINQGIANEYASKVSAWNARAAAIQAAIVAMIQKGSK